MLSPKGKFKNVISDKAIDVITKGEIQLDWFINVMSGSTKGKFSWTGLSMLCQDQQFRGISWKSQALMHSINPNLDLTDLIPFLAIIVINRTKIFRKSIIFLALVQY